MRKRFARSERQLKIVARRDNCGALRNISNAAKRGIFASAEDAFVLRTKHEGTEQGRDQISGT
jgi:hypothetical protein